MFLTARHQSIRHAYRHLTVFLGIVLVTLSFWMYHNTIKQNWYGVPSVSSYNGIKRRAAFFCKDTCDPKGVLN